jgi:hypothetical protein
METAANLLQAFLFGLDQVIRSEQDIDNLVDAYYTDHLKSCDEASEVTAVLHEAYHAILANPGYYIAVGTSDFDAEVAQLHASLSSNLKPEFSCFADAVLTAEQTVAMCKLQATARGIHVLLGTPGSGKTLELHNSTGCSMDEYRRREPESFSPTLQVQLMSQLGRRPDLYQAMVWTFFPDFQAYLTKCKETARVAKLNGNRIATGEYSCSWPTHWNPTCCAGHLRPAMPTQDCQHYTRLT